MRTHSQKLEKWLGLEAVENVSYAMKDFYYPIAMHGVPGVVYAMPGGDFSGEIKAGQEMSALDRAWDWLGRYKRACIARGRPYGQLNAFTSLSSIINAMSGGKGQNIVFTKTGVASNAIGNANDLWVASGQPAAGAAGGAAPGGTVHTSSNTGALGFKNPTNANTAHFTTAYATGSVVANTLLMYDRLTSVAKTMNSTATEAVTGVPTRYTNQTTTASDYIGGNFCFPMNPTTILAATAHNWTVCQYTDDAGNTANSFPSIAGVSGCVVGGVDLAAGSWFMPLASGDVGVKALTQMQCSALVATGTISFVVAHPIAFMPCPVANMICVVDGINTAFNLQFIFDNACLSFMEMPKPATTATTYSGMITAVAE